MEELSKLTPVLLLILAAANVVNLIISAYKGKRDPDEENAGKITKMETSCIFKHQKIDADISGINKSIEFIKENHLSHIEEEMKQFGKKFVELYTILDERLPKKN